MPFLSTVTIRQTSLKILLVEDNADHADLIEDFLLDSPRQKQLSLTRVERLSAAIAALDREKFDIILLDLSLPDSYGFDTVAKVQEYGCNIPIVVLTANSDEQVAFQSLQAGAQDYLIKGHIDSISLTRSLEYAIERYHQKEALRQSEEKYRAIVNNLKAVLFQTDAAGNCTFLNPTWTDLTGFPLSQSLGTPFFNYIYPEDRPGYLEELNALITGQKSNSSIQLRVVAASGKFRWFELQQNLTITSNSTTPSITGMLTSIPPPNLASSAQNQNQNLWQNYGNFSVKNDIPIHNADAKLGNETNLQLNQCPETKQTEKLVADLLNGKVCEWDESGNPQRMTGTHRNIHDYKQAEAELMKFRLVVESSSDAVAMADIHGNHYYQNQAFTDLFEYPTAEAFNAAGGLMISFADPAVGKEVVTAIMGGQSWAGEVEHRSRTGRLIPAWLRANPIQDDNGNRVGLVAIIADISSRKRAEEERRQLTRQLQEAQRVAQIGSWEFDLSTGNISWSDELFRIYHREFGNTPTFEEILQQIHPEDRGRWLEGVQGAMAEGRSFDIDQRVYLPNGEVRYINAKGQGILDESGSVVRLFGTAMDISGRKQVEIAFLREQLLGAIAVRMRQSLQLKDILNTTVTQLQQALQADRVIVYQIFADGTGCAIAEATAAGCQRILDIIFPEEIFPQSIYEQYLQGRVCAVSDRDLGGIVPCLVEFMKEIEVRAKLVVPIIQTGKLWGLLIAHQCFQPRIWQEWEISLLQQLANQLALGIQQSILFEQAQTEISERKAAEIALRESEARERAKAVELEQALNKLKNTQTQLVQQEKMAGLGQLVAGVAHEINNPVSFIFGNIAPAKDYASDLLKLIGLYQKHYPTPAAEIASIIQEIDLDFLKEDFQKLLSSIKEGASRIKDIVLSLRTFSRLDEAEMKEADLNAGINSTLMILEHRLKKHPYRKAIQVIKQYGKLPLVECYPGQLNQVFMNLLSNAIDALEHKLKEGTDFTPTIQIRTEIQEPAVAGNPKLVLIRIADNGSGIPPEVQERIFNPFFTTKPVGMGTGLGLSISYQIIVEKHRGELLCFSELNQGTEFFIKITLFPK